MGVLLILISFVIQESNLVCMPKFAMSLWIILFAVNEQFLFIPIFVGAFLDAIKHLEFDYVASGHYAHIIHSSQDKKEDVCILKLSKDMVSTFLQLKSQLVPDHVMCLLSL